MNKELIIRQVPHIVFHIEGTAGDGEFVAIAREDHSFGETATIGQLLNRGWALASKLESVDVENIYVEIGTCDGGESRG